MCLFLMSPSPVSVWVRQTRVCTQFLRDTILRRIVGKYKRILLNYGATDDIIIVTFLMTGAIQVKTIKVTNVMFLTGVSKTRQCQERCSRAFGSGKGKVNGPGGPGFRRPLNCFGGAAQYFVLVYERRGRRGGKGLIDSFGHPFIFGLRGLLCEGVSIIYFRGFFLPFSRSSGCFRSPIPAEPTWQRVRRYSVRRWSSGPHSLVNSIFLPTGIMYTAHVNSHAYGCPLRQVQWGKRQNVCLFMCTTEHTSSTSHLRIRYVVSWL